MSIIKCQNNKICKKPSKSIANSGSKNNQPETCLNNIIQHSNYQQKEREKNNNTTDTVNQFLVQLLPQTGLLQAWSPRQPEPSLSGQAVLSGTGTSVP